MLWNGFIGYDNKFGYYKLLGKGNKASRISDDYIAGYDIPIPFEILVCAYDERYFNQDIALNVERVNELIEILDDMKKNGITMDEYLESQGIHRVSEEMII